MDYKEKLKLAKEALESGSYDRETIEYIFPELKESEDEMVKKRILLSLEKDLMATKNSGCDTQDLEQCIAWLEKQSKIVAYYEDRLDECACKYFNKGYKHALEKQGEQKCTAEEVLIKAGLKPYKDGDQWCILLGDNIQEGICGFGDTIDDALYAFLNDLIKSQKEQKPTEWSEEDEQRVENLLAIIEGHGYPGEVAWLKSLKERCCPQKHWKPTEEMLEALYRIIPQDVMEKSEDEILLDKLYQGLKYGRILSK